MARANQRESQARQSHIHSVTEVNFQIHFLRTEMSEFLGRCEISKKKEILALTMLQVSIELKAYKCGGGGRHVIRTLRSKRVSDRVNLNDIEVALLRKPHISRSYYFRKSLGALAIFTGCCWSFSMVQSDARFGTQRILLGLLMYSSSRWIFGASVRIQKSDRGFCSSNHCTDVYFACGR